MKKPDSYSGISVINHWITALLVVTMLVLGLLAGNAQNETTESFILNVHIALGLLVLLFIIWRIAFRIYEGFPESPGKNPFERRLAFGVHRIILLILLLQVLSGPLYLFTEGEGMNIFGWFTVYIPLESLAITHEPMESIHVLMGVYILPALLLLHFLGAAKHFLEKKKHDTPAEL